MKECCKGIHKKNYGPDKEYMDGRMYLGTVSKKE
jgi:hypothetical protein